MNLSELLDWDAPGRYLGLELEKLASMIRTIQERYAGRVLTLSRTAGLNSVAIAGGVSSGQLLVSCYLQQQDRLSPLDALTRAGDLRQSDEELAR